MAEVLPPIIQPTPAITMLPTSPDAFQNSGLIQTHSQRTSTVPRSHMFPSNNGSQPYRGLSSTSVAPYTFQQASQLRPENRTSSAPVFRNSSAQLPPPAAIRPYPGSASSTSTASSASSSNPSIRGHYTHSKDDSMLAQRHPNHFDNRASTIITSSSTPDLLMRAENIAKPSPDRYRRVTRRADSSNSTPTLQGQEKQRYSIAFPSEVSTKTPASTGGKPAHFRTSSADDTMIGRPDGLGRYRRRSVGAIEPGVLATPKLSQITTPAPTWAAVAAGREKGRLPPPMPAPAPPVHSATRPIPYYSRRDSHDGSSSANLPRRPASARQDSSDSPQSAVQATRPKTAPRPSQSRYDPRSTPGTARNNAEPPRRLAVPSPLSKPITDETDIQKAAKTTASPPDMSIQEETASPAVQQLSALTDRDANKGVKSRLRRAFSFGSSHELKKASVESATPAERIQQNNEQSENIPADEEEAAVVAKQEAAGLGTSIYSGQGAFAASTDNVSISSTASSASMMLRKMGRGVKKSTRSLKGLFRPKSVIGAPTVSSTVAPSSTTAEVSLVTVEAERERVNISLEPHDQSASVDSYPKLENGSMETGRPGTAEKPGSSQESRDTWSRRSIIGGEQERAEVLAAVRKGILKRSATDVTTSSPAVGPGESYVRISDGSPSLPGTPDERISGDGRGDYFLAASRFANSSTRSLPGAGPHGGARNISFSPRIQFHDVWSSQEYDRRGDVATCNRLTPVLAQQIKEELNSFKMEMEVHELSKPHTHFF